ncbi:30S ribosomal protein S17e [Candidatus Pacearchaeota archaeon]|nr:30S ribosomal protein S17e [Candidatus Pacearchaeota archaeon]
MGRIKTKLIKRISLKLFKQHKEEFKPDFEENKQLVESLADVPSKKIRNVIAGYVTRLVKQKHE